MSISVDGSPIKLFAHRLNFYMVHGYLPNIIDHEDHNKDNNDISNLRECSAMQNMMNRRKQVGCSSKYKGVCWDRVIEKWRSGIKIAGKSTHLGLFTCEILAAISYNDAAVVAFGEFASLNKIKEVGL